MSKARHHHSATFHEILFGVFGLFQTRWRAVSVALLCFALVSAVGTTFVNEYIHRIEQSIADEAGIPIDRLVAEVTSKLQGLREEDLLLFALAARNSFFGDTAVDASENVALAYVVRVNPYVLMLFAFDLLVVFGSWVYFLTLFSDPVVEAYDAARRFPLAVVRMGLLILWLFVRSLLWIPFVGPIIALYLGPRLSLAPTILIRGQAGILQSPKVSLARTKRRWAKIFLWLLGLAFLSFLLLWTSFLIGGVAAVFSAKLGFFLWICSVIGTAALSAGFLTVMATAVE